MKTALLLAAFALIGAALASTSPTLAGAALVLAIFVTFGETI